MAADPLGGGVRETSPAEPISGRLRREAGAHAAMGKTQFVLGHRVVGLSVMTTAQTGSYDPDEVLNKTAFFGKIPARLSL